MDTVSSRQLNYAVFAGMAAPAAMLCSALPWPAALAGLGLAGLCWPVARRGLAEPLPSPLRGAYLLWILLLMAKLAAMSRACFQDTTGFIPVILLALAGTAARSGAKIGARLGAVLWAGLAVLLGGLLACAMADFTWNKLTASHGLTWGWTEAAALGFAPAALLCLPREEPGGLRWGFWLAAGLGAVASVVACGVLGPLRVRLQQPLYDMVRGVNVLGSAVRLEALLSAALSVGFFCAMSLLCAAGASVVRPWLVRDAYPTAGYGVAAAALALSAPAATLPGETWFALSVAFGLMAPAVLWVLRSGSKKETSKKPEKRA